MNSCHDNHEHSHADHSNQDTPHQFFIPKPSIFRKLIIAMNFLDNMIYEMYAGLVGNLDMTMSDLEIPKLFKNILHTRQILFFSIFLGNFWYIYMNINISKFNITEDADQASASNYYVKLFTVKSSIYFLFLLAFWINLLLISYLKFRNYAQMKIKRYEELEKYVLAKTKELANNACHVCNVVKCMRSFHCNYCNQCITKFNLHSNWFNTCIGSQNLLIYSIEIIFLNLFFIFCIMNYSFQIFFIGKECELLFDYKQNLFNLHFWFFLTLFLECKLFYYTKGFLRRSLLHNLTDYEYGNRMRLPYLWKNAHKEFFNPFDRGCLNNLKEVWAGFRNKEIDLVEKINIGLMKNENLNGMSVIGLNGEKFMNVKTGSEDNFIFLNNETDFENNEDNGDHNNYANDSQAKKIKNFEYFVTFDNQIYHQAYNPHQDSKVINWNRIRLYTIIDLINSPFREILLRSLGRENEIDI